MRNLLKYKLYSGALQFTIFISVIIALLLAGIVQLMYTHKYFIKQSKIIIENIELSDSGTIALLQQQEISPDTLILAIPNANENQNVKMHLSHWGIYEKAFVQSTKHKKEFTKCSFIGTGLTSAKRPALFLQETYKPLVVVGNANIRGKAYLPEQGIRPGNINGNSYYGNQLVYGSIEKSKIDLPKLTYKYHELLDYYLYDFMPQSSTDFLELIPKKQIINSFKKRSKGLFSDNDIVLENITLIGNIIIRSTRKITVKATADLRDIIIAAPEIIIENGVQGSFQAISNRSIKIGNNCTLNYPSALVLLEKEEPNSSPADLFNNKIFIDESSTVRGSVCFIKRDSVGDANFKVNIFLSEKSVISGEVYCEGNFELKGNVTGSVYTNQFIVNEGGTIFVNHIYNGTITSDEFPEAYGGILFENEHKNVVKWLY